MFQQRTLIPIQTAYQVGIEEFATKFNLIYIKDKTDYSAKVRNNAMCLDFRKENSNFSKRTWFQRLVSLK